MFRILFCAPFSALPFHCLTSQSLLLLFHAYQSLSVSLCAPPVISLPLLSSAQQNASMPCQFFALRLLALASQLESYLHLSIPFPLRSQRFRISRCYSHPCHSFSPQSCSVLFRFCLFACPIKSISDQRISVSFRIYASQLSSFSVHLYANPVLSQRLCCNATLIASRPSQVRATPLLFKSFWIISLQLLVHSLHFHAIANHIQSVLFHLGATPCHSISPRGRAIPYRISALPCCAVAHQISAFLIRFVAFLCSSFAALFTIQGVLMPYLLSAF